MIGLWEIPLVRGGTAYWWRAWTSFTWWLFSDDRQWLIWVDEAVGDGWNGAAGLVITRWMGVSLGVVRGDRGQCTTILLEATTRGQIVACSIWLMPVEAGMPTRIYGGSPNVDLVINHCIMRWINSLAIIRQYNEIWERTRYYNWSQCNVMVLFLELFPGQVY